MIDLLRDIGPVLGILLGALIGYYGSLATWSRTNQQNQKDQLSARMYDGLKLLNEVHQDFENLLGAKRTGNEDYVSQLPPSRVPAFKAINLFHFPELKQQSDALFARFELLRSTPAGDVFRKTNDAKEKAAFEKLVKEYESAMLALAAKNT